MYVANLISSLLDIPGGWQVFKCRCELKCCYKGKTYQSWDEVSSESYQDPEGLSDTLIKAANMGARAAARIPQDDDGTVATVSDALTQVNLEKTANDLAEAEYNKNLGDFIKKCSETCRK